MTDQVVDVFAAAGLEKPDVSILSEEFLAEIQGMQHKDLAAAALERILRDKIRERSKSSLVQSRSFEEMLERAVSKYLNRSMETAEVIQHLIELARKMRDAGRKGEELGLTSDEFAFYEALAENESAREVMSDQVLGKMAHELVSLVKKNASIDWTRKASVQAKLRLLVKKLLARYGYPPDAAKLAIDTVLQQAEKLGINVTDSIPPDDASPDGDGGSRPPREFPYPIAVFDSLVKTQLESSERVNTYLGAIERAVVLVTASSLAWLRREGGELPAGAVALLEQAGGKRISMGAWVELCWQVAALLPANANHAVVKVARRFVTDKGKPSDLTKLLQHEVVPYRNDKGHTVGIPEEAFAEREIEFRKHWETLKTALSPLKQLHLFVRAQLKDFDAQGGIYNVRSLTGSNEHFPIEEVRVAGRLQEHWAYFGSADDPVPLPLAPMFRFNYRAELGKRELLVPRTLELNAGKKIELCQLIGADTFKHDVPAV